MFQWLPELVILLPFPTTTAFSLLWGCDSLCICSHLLEVNPVTQAEANPTVPLAEAPVSQNYTLQQLCTYYWFLLKMLGPELYPCDFKSVFYVLSVIIFLWTTPPIATTESYRRAEPCSSEIMRRLRGKRKKEQLCPTLSSVTLRTGNW